MYRFVIILCVLNLSESALESQSNNLRVIGGRNITDGEFPFVVLLVVKKKLGYFRFCSASIISYKFVLTASHCFERVKVHEAFVWLGNYTTAPQEDQLVSVRKIISHPRYFKSDSDYSGVILLNDVCLLHVEEMAGVSCGRLLAVDHLALIGLPVKYVGGGATSRTIMQDMIRPLQVGEGAIKPCDAEDWFQLQAICVMPKCSEDEHLPWKGDSGGPLVFEGKILGVASYSRRFYLPRSVYCPVSSYLDWIYDVMQTTE